MRVSKGCDLIAVLGLIAALCAAPAIAQESGGLDAHITKDNVDVAKKSYSPFVDKAYPNRVFWGDTHLHTQNSPDAYLFGVRLSPDDALRFAKGEQVNATHGLPVKLVRPLDFLVVADHSEYLGLMPRLFEGDPQVLSTEYGRQVYDLAHEGDDGPFQAAMVVINDISNNDEKMEVPELEASIWEGIAKTADRHNQPGAFTAFIGYEWTSLLSGNNLHRVVIFKDDAGKATRVVPFSSFDSPDPEKLWDYLAEYERSTGGNVLAIAHNGNLSNGMMFQLERISGGPLTREYAEERMRWEPLYEVTQIKGDGETHPFLSPNDEFADFGNWDKSNLNGSQAKEDWMLQYEYARSALKLGLQLEGELGVNPYKFGMIGSTDSHTGLATTREENFWGKHSGLEPEPNRVDHILAKMGDVAMLGWEQLAGGLAAVWARENTRESLFEAMERKETYATTGSRISVRVFGGWDFNESEVERPDFAEQGYTRGVPMGGDLRSAPGGASPSFMIRAVRDPDGANLDRVQMVKGWLDSSGELQEQVYDVVVSDDRRIGDDGRCEQAVGSTVDIQNATYENSIGDAVQMGYWKDPDFDPAERAFYYVRVIEIPTPRWIVYDAKYFGDKVSEDMFPVAQERAYTSPIWYTP
jgi:hypothetical protein